MNKQELINQILKHVKDLNEITYTLGQAKQAMKERGVKDTKGLIKEGIEIKKEAEKQLKTFLENNIKDYKESTDN